MMTKNILNVFVASLLSALMLAFAGCSLDVTNPNQASEEQVLTTAEGIRALAIGMQQFYATSALEAYIVFTGVTSRELAINTTFANLLDLEDGGAQLAGDNANVTAIFSRSFRVIAMAEDLIENAPNVPLAAGTRSGILALAQLYKAMALGFLAQSFEQAPLTARPDGRSQFQPRADLLDEAIQLLDNAAQLISDTPPSSEFTSNILGSGFDLSNTIHAYRARYNLLAGNYQVAITAANAVDPAAMSVFTYDALNQNPVFATIVTDDDFAPRDNFGSNLTDPADGRLQFYLTPRDTLSAPNDLPIEFVAGFFASATSSIPAYLPGEMALIRAEANLMTGNPSGAVSEIDAVRTKTAVQDPFGVGANLPTYSGPTDNTSLMNEIFQQRRAELFMSGMSWEDSRRLNQPGPSTDPFERNRNFYPYPDQERLNNPNTPPDPAN